MEEHRQTSVLFVCLGNICRSVFAEAFAKERFGEVVEVSSAGLNPQPPDWASDAIDTLRAEFAMDASSHIPRGVRSLDLESYSVVVAMDESVGRELKRITRRDIRVWRIEDPWGQGLDVFGSCAMTVLNEVESLELESTDSEK